MVHKINKENEMQDIKINIMLEINKKNENKNARHKINMMLKNKKMQDIK